MAMATVVVTMTMVMMIMITPESLTGVQAHAETQQSGTVMTNEKSHSERLTGCCCLHFLPLYGSCLNVFVIIIAIPSALAPIVVCSPPSRKSVFLFYTSSSTYRFGPSTSYRLHC